MNIREQFNERMARVSEQIDVKNDPFANLFSKKATGNGRVVHSKLAQRIKRARMEKVVSVAKLNGERRAVHSRPPSNKSQSGFQMLWIPAGGALIGGLFVLGVLGAKWASGSYNTASQVPQGSVTIQEAQATRTSPSPGETLQERTVSAAAVVQMQKATPVPAAAPVPKQLRAPKTVVLAAVAPIESPKQKHTTPSAKASAGTLLDQGHLREQAGDFPAARNYFQQAFENGSLPAALAIGRSFDPRFVRKVTGTTQMANAELSRKWYEKWYLTAIEKGEISSRIRFDRLVQGLRGR